MAELLLNVAVSNLAETLGELFIQESTRPLLKEVKSQVEWIEKEVKYMHGSIQHLERREGSNSNHLELENMASNLHMVTLEAEDVIQTFLVKSRRKGVLYLFDKYRVNKKLEKISHRLRQISKRITKYEQTDIAVTVETPAGVGVGAATIVAPALEKLDYILSQKLITNDLLIKRVERVRDDDLANMHSIVSNLNSTGEPSQRQKVWLEEVMDICDYTVGAAEKFIARKEMLSRMGILWQVLYLFEPYASDWKFIKNMRYISIKCGDALYRRWIFGDGGEDNGDRIGSISRPVLSFSTVWWNTAKALFLTFNFLFVPIIPAMILFLLAILITGLVHRTKKENILTELGISIVLDSISMGIFYFFLATGNIWLIIVIEFIMDLYYVISLTVSLSKSLKQNLESTRRFLALMRVLFSDIGSADSLILNERQKVWVQQLRLVSRKGRSLDAACPKDGFLFLFSRIKFACDIKELLNEIIDISDRKNVYGIASIQARKELISSGPGESEQVIEPNGNSATGENPQASPASSSCRHIKGLQLKFQLITGEKQMMDALFRDAQEIRELDGRSKVWVEQMEGIARKTEAVIHECASQLEHKPMLIYILKWWARHVITGKINRIREKIEDASRIRKAYGLFKLQSRAESLSTVQILRPRTQPSLIVKESRIVGFDQDIEVLIAQLLSDEKRRCIISIVGIEGTGKTTLARLIYDNKDVRECFDCLIWVSVSPSFTVEQFLEEIAKEAATQIMGGQQIQDKTLVFTTLASKKYLIVVDGMQTSYFLDTLRETIPDMSTRSRFLLTTRNANVARQAGTRSFVHALQLLDDEHSWILFTRNLRVIPSELTDVGKKIVTKCGGLPLEILRKCELLSHKDAREEEWSSVQEQPNQGQNPWSETLDAVNMSLPSYLRRCLFYFRLFPADFGIPARRLLVLWVAEGLVHNGEDQELPELIAERYLTELIDRNMVQVTKRKTNGKVKICRLPNALHEPLLIKANESRLPQVQTGTDVSAVPQSSRIRQVADRLDEKDIWHKHIHGNTTSDSASLRTSYKDVLCFLSFDPREGSGPGQDICNFLKLCISSSCLLLLRVLDLEGVYKPKLPKNIARLTRLRYLGLRWTYLESLPSSISTLLRLQTLDLNHTYIHTLTSSIWKMELRHLFLSETYRTRFPLKPKGHGISSSLSDLQTLWGLFGDEETPVKGGLDKLINIRKLGIACQSMSLQQGTMESQLDAVADWIVKLDYLQTLRLKSRDEQGQPWRLHLKSLKRLIDLTDMYLLGCLSDPSILSEFPPSLVELTLSHSKLEVNPMQILKDLPNLRSLSLLAESYMGNILICDSQGFPQLYVLKVWNLEQLEEWKIEQEAFPSLKQLEIRSCPRMKMLPDGLKHVNSLLELKLTNMPVEVDGDENNIPPNCQLHRDDSE